MDEYLKELTKYTSCRLNEAAPTRRDQSLTVAGLVIAARVMTTKRGTRIGLMTLDDRSGRMEVMLYSEALDRYAEWLEKDKILVVSGQVSFDDFNGGLKMSAREVMDLGSARENLPAVYRSRFYSRRLINNFLSVLVTYWNLTAQEPYLSMYTTSALMRERA